MAEEQKVLTQKQLTNILDHGTFFHKTEKIIVCDLCFRSPISSGITWQDHTQDICLDCLKVITEPNLVAAAKLVTNNTSKEKEIEPPKPRPVQTRMAQAMFRSPPPKTKMMQGMFKPKQTLMLQSSQCKTKK